ncbi:MAG: sigma-E processing peptidase SpoIIGA [Desulfitobacteriaceae bacterium]
MSGEGTYLDLDFLINAGMDAFLLVLTGKLLRHPVRKKGVLFGALVGGIPVLLAVFGPSTWLTLSKIVTPFFMVKVAFAPQGMKSFGRMLLSFWLTSAGLGGFIYALWGWMRFDGQTSEILSLAVNNLWILPLTGGVWWLGQNLLQRWQSRAYSLEKTIYDLEIDFGNTGKVLQIRALLDTGNQLRDPLTGTPVMLVEEQVASAAIPEELKDFLKLPWRETGDPWPFLWKTNPLWLKHLVFIPFKGIGGENWLLGVRPERVNLIDGGCKIPVQATVALVQQVLSTEGEYQALLHQEHAQKGANCT